jgi:type I restriction enzyme S subunit
VSSTEWKSSPLGKIPVDWTVEKGESLADRITKGASPNWQGFSYADEGVLFVTSENVRDGFLDVSSPKFVEAAFNKKQKNSILVRGDILINLVGASIGRSCRFDTSLPYTANVNQAVCVFRPNGTANADYLKHFLQAPSTIGRLIGSQADGARPNVSLTDIKTFHFLLPPTSEQQKIAAILSTWDRAIALTEKLIAAKQKRKQALMQQLLTGKVRFNEFVKSKQRQRTPVGDMPSDWKKSRLGKIVEKVKRKNPDGEVHVLTASGEHGLVDQREFFNRSVAGADLSGYYLLKQGEFAYNRSAMKGYPFGAIKRLDRYEQGVLSTLYICFGITAERCDSNYLCQFFEARLLDRQLRGVTQVGGRAHGLLNITDGDFYAMSLVLPSIDEQRKIAAVLVVQDAEIEQWRRRLDSLKQQKKGLMQQLLTGKVRVNVDAEMVKG